MMPSMTVEGYGKTVETARQNAIHNMRKLTNRNVYESLRDDPLNEAWRLTGFSGNVTMTNAKAEPMLCEVRAEFEYRKGKRDEY
jgi:hypothetical protein